MSLYLELCSWWPLREEDKWVHSPVPRDREGQSRRWHWPQVGLFGEAGVGLATAVELLRHCRAQSMVRAARTRLSQEGREGWATCP